MMLGLWTWSVIYLAAWFQGLLSQWVWLECRILPQKLRSPISPFSAFLVRRAKSPRLSHLHGSAHSLQLPSLTSWTGNGGSVGVGPAFAGRGGHWWNTHLRVPVLGSAAEGWSLGYIALKSWWWYWLWFPALPTCQATLSSLLGDSLSSPISSDMLFYCLCHRGTDCVETKSPDWSLSQKFGENWGRGRDRGLWRGAEV